MKIKTNEMTGAALDWAVAKAEGAGAVLVSTRSRGEVLLLGDPTEHCDAGEHYAPSTNWAQGGQIIEREWIDLHCVNDSLWEAECPATGGLAMQNGPTPLIAAMRCYVYSKLGDTVEAPDELAAA